MPITTAQIGDRSWRDRAQEINRTEVQEWLDQHEPNIIIATDGSIRENLTGWGGAVWTEGEICFEWSLARAGRSCSFSAESEAIEDDFTWIEHNTCDQDRVVILTDSMSVVNKAPVTTERTKCYRAFP